MNNAFCFDEALQKIAKLLPHQGPIKDFIHQNTLSAFLELEKDFDSAVLEASRLYKAQAYMDLSFYREKFNEGKILTKKLEKAINYYLPKSNSDEKLIIKDALFKWGIIPNRITLKNLSAPDKSQNKESFSFRQKLLSFTGPDFEHQCHRFLFRLLAAYLDQGVCLWPQLKNSSSFVDGVLSLALESLLPLTPWLENPNLALWLRQDANEAIETLLYKIVGDESLYSQYLLESLLAHPGWSGMVNMISKHPEALAKKPAIDLKQLVLVKLSLEWLYINFHFKNFNKNAIIDTKIKPSENPDNLARVYFTADQRNKTSFINTYENISTIFLQKIWQKAFEDSYYNSFAAIIINNKKNYPENNIKYQAVFCIDDRECSFRRILEQSSPKIETFATAGFFGLDCYLKTQNPVLQKICPANLEPNIAIIAKDVEAKGGSDLVHMAKFLSRHGANSTFLGFLSANTLGHLSLFRLLYSFFRPLNFEMAREKPSQKLIEYEKNQKKIIEPNIALGFSEEEMSNRVFNVLNNMGLVKSFAPLIFIIGHGSSSTNNPHFAAYDCGACSGRPGDINAKVFALMANRPGVRKLLEKRGLLIPDTTRFIGAFHDTASDQVDYFDVEALAEPHQELFQCFKKHVENTSELNALERCKKFALTKKNINQKQALKEVHYRTKALFEPRTELGHATNAALLIGRRARSYQANLDRRAFLHSYDPCLDPNGHILNNILSAALPVCGGINLEYYFSRIDPAIYGCGSKLSHNVVGLLGVGNGLDDDLRTGLPIQMTEIHEPIRLLIVIEQEPKVISSIIENNSNLKPWVFNNWVKIASLSPNENSIKFFEPTQESWQLMES